MTSKKIAPSILSADFSRLGQEIRAVEEAGADFIHVDVMDGHFVPNITIGPLIVEAAKRVTSLPLDVHLMIENPEKYIRDFVAAGSSIVTVHLEACTHLNGVVGLIKNAGAKAGVAINPSTPVGALDCIIEDLDMVLVMSVNPGFGGQSFIGNSLRKVSEVRRLIALRGLKGVEIEVDGGIKTENIAAVSSAGADVFVAGSAIFGSDDYRKTMERMRRKIAQTR